MHYTLCDMFSDLTQNAIEAGSSIITVEMIMTDTTISVSIRDNGKGMTGEQLARATDPFYTDGIKHPGRKVGLGIPFLIQTAETTGGSWNIRSDRGNGADIPSGTAVDCSFDLTNIDTPPVGDVAGYFRHILSFDGRYELIISGTFPGTSFTVKRSEVLDALGLAEQGSFTDAGSLKLLGMYLESLLEAYYG
ncbi:MAG: HAMP domain-containing histidine kinase [Treponema sp.]|nr:MAG: HAMP domain-containing histidine kinase [Treponema sp.]